jgi:hypothetical protein
MTPIPTATPYTQGITSDIAGNTYAVVAAYNGGVIMQIISQGGQNTAAARTTALYDALGNTIFSKTWNIGEATPAEIYKGFSWNIGPTLRFGLPFSKTLTAQTTSNIRVIYFK